MPKKFKGENSKAAAARERISAAREAEETERRKREEDEYWRDNYKPATKKQERKADKERKRQDQLDRKQEAKKMLEEEESQLKGKSSSGSGAGAAKVTHAQIQEAEELRRGEGACALPQGVTSGPDLEANPNHLFREQQEKGELSARTVDEAIDMLTVSTQEKVDKNPERRLKAAYTTFEERELPRLKAENPNLRQSQVKQLLRKQWMRSPENPMNQL